MEDFSSVFSVSRIFRACALAIERSSLHFPSGKHLPTCLSLFFKDHGVLMRNNVPAHPIRCFFYRKEKVFLFKKKRETAVWENRGEFWHSETALETAALGKGTPTPTAFLKKLW